MARRDHPVGVPVRDRPPVHLADIRAIGGLADDLATGTLELSVDVGFDGTAFEAGWTVEARVGDLLRPAPRRGAGVSPVPAHPLDPTSRSRCGACASTAGAGSMRPTGPPGRSSTARSSRPGRGCVAPRGDPGRRAVVVGDADPVPADASSCARPAGEVVETAELRIGFRRVEIRGVDLLINGRRVYLRGVNRHDFDQRDRAGHLRRVDPRRPGADEAVRVQRGPDLALPERPGVHRPDRRARAVRDRRGGHRERTRSRARCATTRATCRPGSTASPGWSSATRTIPRSSPGRWATSRATAPTTTRPPPGSAATTRRARSTTRARSAGTGRATRAAATSSARCTREIGAIVEHARSGRQRHPLIMCEYSHAMGNSNGTLAEYWDAIEIDPRPAGRLHLGVVGPRPRSRCGPTARPAGPTAATSATSPTTATSSPTGWSGRTGRQSRPCGSTRRSPRWSASPRRPRGWPAARSRSGTTRTGPASAGCGRGSS